MGIEMKDSHSHQLDPKLSSSTESNSAHWLKVFVIGGNGSGKTSLVETLIHDAPTLANKPTVSLRKVIWKPGCNPKAELDPDPKITDVSPVDPRSSNGGGQQEGEEDTNQQPWTDLRIDLWDLMGKPVMRSIQMLGITPGGFFLVTFSLTDVEAPATVALWIRAAQIRAPGSVFVLVGTHSDKILSERKKTIKIQNVLNHLDKENMKEIEELKIILATLKSDPKLKRSSSKFLRIEQRLLRRPKIHETVFPVSCINSEGINEFREEFLKLCMDSDIFPVLTISKKFLLYIPIIDHLKNAGHVIVPRLEFAQAVFKDASNKDDKQLDDILAYFDKMGAIIDLRHCGHISAKKRHVVCVNPVALVNCACATHIDAASKAFRFEAARFWPKGSGHKKPDPGLLVMSLEEIPAKSLIQEMLLPLLWQDYVMSNTQLTALLEELIQLGILVRGSWSSSDDRLYIPNYPGLSSERKVCAIQLHRLPNTSPSLNWTSKPFAGDAQLSLRYEFPVEAPAGTCLRLVGFCGSLAEQWHSYSHWWKDGLLLRLGECWLCISYSLERYVELTCRVNAEDVEDSLIGDNIWLHLVPFLYSIEEYLERYMPGLIFRTTVQPVGSVFNVTNKEESPWISVQNLVAAVISGSSVVRKTCGDKEIEFNLQNIYPFKAISLQDSGYIGQVLADRCLPKFDRLIASLKQAEKKMLAALPEESPVKPKKAYSGQRIEVKWSLDKKSTPETTASSVSKGQDGQAVGGNGTTEGPGVGPSVNGEVTILRAGTVMVDQAEEQERMDRIVFSFIASIMAQATAEIVSTQADDQHKLTNRDPLVAAAQREMASITAKAVIAAQLGDHVGACRSVVAAANAVHRTIKRRDQYNEAPKSKLCNSM